MMYMMEGELHEACDIYQAASIRWPDDASLKQVFAQAKEKYHKAVGQDWDAAEDE
jgi:predicted Zn-dependent protease